MSSSPSAPRISLFVVAAILAACSGSAPGEEDTSASEAPLAATAPYPASTAITGISWDFAHEINLAAGSDLWPTTWGADGNVWTGWGDGGGFGGSNSVDRVSVGFAKVTGTPPSITGVNVWGNTNPGGGRALHQATFCGKPESAISAGGVLYVWIGSSYNDSAADNPRCPANPAVSSHRLAVSTDDGVTWKEQSWTMTENNGAFVFNNFINFGQDNAGAPGGYVYAYGYKIGDTFTYLARVPANQVTNLSAYRLFTGTDASGAATWSSAYTTSLAKPVTSADGGLGATFYHAVTKRYLSANFRTGVGSLVIYDAPEPWGPWTTVESESNWGGFGNTGESLALTFPTKWISADGKTIWGVFSWGAAPGDAFHLMKATLTFGTKHVKIVGLGGKCADDGAASLAIHDCDGAASQAFTFTGGKLVSSSGKCLDAPTNVNHGFIVQSTCSGASSQKWTVSGTEIVNGGGRCLDLSHANTTNGTPIVIFDCSSTKANQAWTLTATN